jgi:hypothetical protein
MDIRQYDLWIDGVLVPEEFLEDSETQLDHSAMLIFNEGLVANYDSHDEMIAPHVASFASLRGVLMNFVLCDGDGPLPCVTILTLDRTLHWQLGEGYGIQRFQEAVAWALEWGATYTFYQNLGRADERRMTLWVERSRQPLAPVHPNAPLRGAPLRERVEVDDHGENKENVY